jgi:exo-1,4-beta-D-glucosaminidase
MDTSAFARSQWYVTPTTTYADMRALGGLPSADPRVAACMNDGAGRVTVTNDTGRVVFFLRLRLATADGADATPVRWSDDDLTLMPGERRTVTVRADPSDAGTAPALAISGWNTPASSQMLGPCA